MSGRHDTLYGRARIILNQNIKRLWFKVNPFLEKKGKLDTEPESPSKFIQPLQSTVVSEGFVNEASHEFRDIAIGDFWSFLYSERWYDGCSVRVMEGQLLDHLMTTLHILIKEGEAVKHKTYAFARNKREKRGCYKLANQEGCQTIQETLLLEFTYYGRKVKPAFRRETSESSAYPESLTASSQAFSSPAPDYAQTFASPILTKKKRLTKTRRMSCVEFRPQPVIAPNLRKLSMNVSPQVKKQASYGNIAEEGESQQEMQDGTDFDPNQRNQIEVIPLNTSVQTNTSSESDYRLFSEVPNLYRLPCTERINPYLDPPQKDKIPANIEVVASYSNEMYLSDGEEPDVSNNNEPVINKLRKRKKELAKTREENREKLKQIKNRLSPTSSPADSVKESKSFHMEYRLLDKVPTFEEFIYMLEEEQKYDPRFKRARQITRKLARRYNMTKDAIIGAQQSSMQTHQSFQFGRGFRRSSLIVSLPPIESSAHKAKKPPIETTKANRRSPCTTPAPGKKIIPMERIVSATNIESELSPSPNYKQKQIKEIAKGVGVVTDSYPCEKHVLDNLSPSKGSSQNRVQSSSKKLNTQTAKKKVKKTLITPSIILSTPNGISYVLHEPPRQELKQKSVVGRMSSRSIRSESKGDSRNDVNQPSPVVSEEEEEEEEEELSSLFDTSRLNYKYSFERLRGKNYQKKKPAFFNVLKKFYRMHKAVDAFCDPNSPEFNQKKQKRKSIFHRLMNPDQTEHISEQEAVGKLKHYNFLLHRRRRTRCRVEDPDLFSTISMVKFREFVRMALDDFVVRREFVVSDIGGKNCTTITFTRKAVFDDLKFCKSEQKECMA